MIEYMAQTEGAPSAYPAIPGLTGDALTMAPVAWQRVEHHIAWRFAPRTVTWTVKGPGMWIPPLRPVADLTAEIWDGSAWIAASPDATWNGYDLTLEGPYRITATVGAGPVPEAVAAAVQRLATYLAAEADTPAGARSWSASVGQLSETINRDPAHMAKALQNSGAADLLRPYRRA
ncbi:hypothetical protein DSD19_05460 [Rhodovulum sp. BSW8]|uniref:PhiE125 gp8 family phage protein n=1 Tax=Rhodovulum visakhapatnamense TaxID=364297 RepID=A0ABS1RN40_9RHOB|nr:MULTISPECIES: hypothetical protein [Rhodovulum]MBL3571949.1 hypothetical protein [Rhodovulum visakhapatnamense]MBL3580574.1 hypothetical protein [Rhodovulum visakhapatnamense]OLS46039.1 hypothetical protein BV509_17870 [Rhodovulum sulfidophilum]RBO54170.1 hypothetical protein DSD19_05460 [Rhodovulum sp. BSW8]